MKKFLLFFLITQIIFFSSCIENIDDGSIPGYKDGMIQGYKVDNSERLEDIDFTEYDIVTLNEYFLQANSASQGYSKQNSLYDFSIDSVNEKFPIECLRKSGYSFYSVYKVIQGGYYYVFWASASPVESAGTEDDSFLIAVFASYLSEKADYEDFSTIIAGESTAKDVLAIDKYFDFVGEISHATLSYSLTDLGLVEVEYDVGEATDPLEHYVVSSVKLVSRDSSLGHLACILKMDFPS